MQNNLKVITRGSTRISPEAPKISPISRIPGPLLHYIANFKSSLKMNKNVKVYNPRSAVGDMPVKSITMWHTVAHIDHDNEVCGVEITTDPYDHVHKAAIIMHKTRSKNVAAQVARFVRRATGIERVTINRSNIARDASIGFAVSRTMQYIPNDRTPCQDLVKKISITPVRELLAESDKSDNASRSRYFVLEVRTGSQVHGRFVSNKTHSVERMWREAPPDQAPRSELFTVGKFADHSEAKVAAAENPIDYTTLWTRHCDPERLRALLEYKNGEWVFRRTGLVATRHYESGTVICIGPHTYTLRQIENAIKYGAWLDTRRTEHRG